jgi:hypothetical protein
VRRQCIVRYSSIRLDNSARCPSARFKDEIKPIKEASEVIYDLRPVSFRYKPEIEPARPHSFGLIAEDVVKISPDLVTRDKLRRYADMAAVLDRALAIAPKDVDTKVARAQIDLDSHADPRPLHATIEAILAEDTSAVTTLADTWLNLALCERDPAGVGRPMVALSTNTYRPA